MVNVGMLTSWHVKCGISSYSENLSRALSKKGVNVFIIRVPRFGGRTAGIFQNIVSKIPGDKIDVIHVQHEYGIYMHFENVLYAALKELKKPIITTMHSVGDWETDRVIEAFSDKLIVHNKYCFKRFGWETKKLGIIPHGATPQENPPPPREECKQSLQLQRKAPIVGYLGYISPYKGIEVLIEAMAKVKNAGLLLGGGWHHEREPQYTVNLRDWSLRTLPGRCRWTGYVADNDLDRVFGAMDVFVYPSRFATESGALIMALSHGKAVIASHLMPFREKAEAGALMTFRSKGDLAKKIKLLLENEDRRRELEEGALEYARANSWDKVAEKHVRLYEEAVGNK